MKMNSGTITTFNDERHYRNIENQYQSLLESLPVAIYTCDKNGLITFYNSQAAILWGRSPEIGKELWCGSWKIYSPDGEPLALDECPMAIVLKTGEVMEDCEILIERPDGSKVFVVPHPKPLFDDEGNIVGAVNMLVDVSRKKIDEEKSARLAAIVESSVAAIISKTLEGIITSWNPAAERIFGFSQAEMVGKPITKLIPHDRLEEESSILARLARGEKIEHYETKRLTRDNKLIDISLTVSPLRDESGKVIGASKIARDITKAKETQRMVRESQERFRMAVESIDLGTWQYDPIGQELSWSPECRKIYDVPDDLPIDYSLFLKLVDPEDIDFVQKEIERSMNPDGDGKYDIEFRILRYGSGARRWVRSKGKVYFDQMNIPERFIGTVLDITDDKNAKKELELIVSQRTEALEKINKQLQRSNAELAQFASVASHDLQEPLRKVQMYSERILQNPKDEEAFHKYFPKIITASSRMSQLIKDILHYAQIGEGNEKFSGVDLNEVLNNVCLDYELKIRERNAVVEFDRLPVVKGIASQLHQLFSNLMSNSLKFSRKTPHISIRCRKIPYTGELGGNKNLKKTDFYNEIEFRDNGIGFDQGYSSLIFEIFQRLEDRENYSGTGIGLAVCKKIIENHRGLISVNSLPEQGTTFRIVLPAD
jgi:PAS domain S-box-containing protein